MDRLRKVPLYAVIALLVYMPFHVFLAQSLSLVTGGLEVWKGAKDVVLMVALVLTLCLVAVTRTYRRTYYPAFLLLTAAYGLIHLLVWAAHSHIDRNSAILGTVYNDRLPWFLLLAWGAVLVHPGKINVRVFIKLVLGLSVVVSVLGLIQYNLPKDFLTHLGYTLDRGVRPSFFIDDKPDLPRMMSTFKDPNSLGAYLILPITLLCAAWLRRAKDRLLISGALLLNGVALFLTFSRGAWIGTVVSVGLLLFWNFRQQAGVALKRYWPIIGGLLVLLAIGVFLLRDQYVVQNVVFHADESTTLASSDDLHYELAKKGVEGIADKPLGHGPGTAGLVAIHTTGFLTEDYFIQIGYEVGIIGLLLFLGILTFVVKLLGWTKPRPVVVPVLASLAGLSVMNLLFHTWSNEAVAAQWWLVAGLVIGSESFWIKRGSLGNHKVTRTGIINDTTVN